jgi:2-(1,2-epoxy-1,2-dihydrophenyl)acetyl-CoA isomerase
MTESAVATRLDGPVATVELNRPDRLNPLDEPTRAALLTALTDAAAHDGVLAIVLTGAGRAFCVGQDLAAVAELEDAHDTVSRTYNPLIDALRGCPKPVVAAVNGPAVGAGMGLALACDLIVMAESASMSCAFGRMALVPDSGTTWFLARRLGHQRAFHLATSGRKITSAEAVALGLANETAADDELHATANKRAADLAAGPRRAIALTKQLLRQAADADLASMLEQEALAQGIAAVTEDHLSRRAAFLAR